MIGGKLVFLIIEVPNIYYFVLKIFVVSYIVFTLQIIINSPPMLAVSSSKVLSLAMRYSFFALNLV